MVSLTLATARIQGGTWDGQQSGTPMDRDLR